MGLHNHEIWFEPWWRARKIIWDTGNRTRHHDERHMVDKWELFNKPDECQSSWHELRKKPLGSRLKVRVRVAITSLRIDCKRDILVVNYGQRASVGYWAAVSFRGWVISGETTVMEMDSAIQLFTTNPRSRLVSLKVLTWQRSNNIDID